MGRRQRTIGIDADTRRGVGRRLPGDGVMEHGGGRVDVAPRTLLAVERILFDRRILRRQDPGQRARPLAHRLACRAEVDEDGNAVAPDHDVRRLDVAMHIVGRQAAGRLAQELANAMAVLELHDGVGRAVGLEVAQDRHDVRMAETGERAGLVEEAFATPGEILGEARATRHHLAAGVADGELDRQVFLDGDELGELRVEGAIGDAEATMPDHRIEPVITEPRAGRQSLNVVGGHGHAQPCP